MKIGFLNLDVSYLKKYSLFLKKTCSISSKYYVDLTRPFTLPIQYKQCNKHLTNTKYIKVSSFYYKLLYIIFEYKK